MITSPRIPPQDTETERALLGALMLNQNAMYEVADIVAVDSFYTGRHRTIYDAMLSLHSKGEPIDVVTVWGRLRQRNRRGGGGGAAFFSDLFPAAAPPGGPRHYAEVV